MSRSLIEGVNEESFDEIVYSQALAEVRADFAAARQRLRDHIAEHSAFFEMEHHA